MPASNTKTASSSEGNGKKRKRDSIMDSSDAPVFIQKTYDMIERCDPKIACWTESGDKFIVKNQSALAKSFIPLYFNHSNYSSFTRQLNFYGFQKINSEQIKNGDFSGEAARHVKFEHEYFRRGKPELLPKIRRSTHGSNQKFTQLEIESLKENVFSLQKTLENATSVLSEKIEDMSARFEKIIKEAQVSLQKSHACNCEHKSSIQDEFIHEKKRQKVLEPTASLPDSINDTKEPTHSASEYAISADAQPVIAAYAAKVKSPSEKIRLPSDEDFMIDLMDDGVLDSFVFHPDDLIAGLEEIAQSKESSEYSISGLDDQQGSDNVPLSTDWHDSKHEKIVTESQLGKQPLIEPKPNQFLNRSQRLFVESFFTNVNRISSHPQAVLPPLPPSLLKPDRIRMRRSLYAFKKVRSASLGKKTQ